MSFVQSVKPHEFEQAVMLRWLEELEKKIEFEIHERFARGGGFQCAAADKLSVPPPYDKVYWTYLVSMIELVQGTPQTYEFANGVFKEAYGEYARYVQRRAGLGKRRALR
ncbi:MAG: hypothetical protein IKM42_06425 [Clostridia bacterium]|nr:hypothetical protein [Clostridia bacterium]